MAPPWPARRVAVSRGGPGDFRATARPPRRGAAVVVLAAALLLVATGVSGGAGAAPCFGAAARDRERPCRNPDLRTSVVPKPAEAQLAPGEPCTYEPGGLRDVAPCAFGAPAGQATRTFAIVGDSHAMHWRAAVAALARARGWRGISITRSHCPFSFAVKELERRDRAGCERWKRDVVTWLEGHPEVDLLFAGQLISSMDVVRDRGVSKYDAETAGYRQAWEALPGSVRHIVVLRDTPRAPRGWFTCVRRAMTAGRPAGRRCAGRRSELVLRDPALAAAVQMRSPRMHLVDLTDFICGRRRCFPVVGGALVFKDGHHLTRTFSTTLGPYVGRVLDARGIG